VCGGFILSLPITIQAETEQQSNGPVCPPEKQKNQPSKNFKVTSFEISEDKVVYLFPQGDLYPFNIADPNRVGLSFQFQEYTETEIPDVGDTRFYLKAGGNIGIFRVANKSEPDHGWQLNLIGGFDAMFDIDGSLLIRKGSGLRLTHVVDFDFLVITVLPCSLFYFSALFLQSVFNSFSNIIFEFSGVGGRNFGIERWSPKFEFRVRLDLLTFCRFHQIWGHNTD
jgi:hypothetical protein